jgi:hypothetical protein
MRVRKIIAGSVCVFLVVLATNLFAAPIRFIHEGAGSGTLNGTSFTDADFVITAFGDTVERQAYDGGSFIDHTQASIWIDGVGTFGFLSSTRTFVYNAGGAVGFSRAGINGADLYNGPYNEDYRTWDMLSSIGPDTGGAGLLQWGLYDVETDAGILWFSDSECEGLFQANVVPVPAAVWLLGSGLIGLFGIRGRKRE